jgi:ubiquinone/menaquinone biosynthesis C-methylase UbiE
MPVMSRFERAFCCGAVWRSTSAVIVRELRAQRLGRDVLEIGAGSGSVAQHLLARNPELALTAIDIDPQMTQAAATRLRGFPNASAKTADATAMPFPDDSFDSVVSCLMLHHVVDWQRAVDEVARVLRPGGTFLGYDLVRTPLASMFHRLDGSPHRLIVADEIQAECVRNGLTISVQSWLLGHVMRFVACKDTAKLTKRTEEFSWQR